ncbi:dihydrofolate reductase family protein [Pseudactinotalea sp.]|uniref:dihydrofolate reductase family protein n=1 Tax=Pseudactinotalea sp. TaxID=1926260 RepID=UPI003B3B437C
MISERRRVVANIALSIDGCYQGPAGPHDMGWVMPHAVSDIARNHLTSLWQPATTVLLGRVNAEGFLSYWPQVADDENADPRDRAYGAWMRDSEKVVLSSTLTEIPWKNARILDTPAADAVHLLRAERGGDIVIFASASVIKDLLKSDQVDRLALTVFPEIIGGRPFFDSPLPPSGWSLSTADASDGVVAQVYDRLS